MTRNNKYHVESAFKLNIPNYMNLLGTCSSKGAAYIKVDYCIIVISAIAFYTAKEHLKATRNLTEYLDLVTASGDLEVHIPNVIYSK